MGPVNTGHLKKFAKGFEDKARALFAKKSDIPSSLPAAGGDADTVNGHTVNADVPEGAKFTDTVYSHPTSPGNRHIPLGGSAGQILRWTENGTAEWGGDSNTTYSIMKGASASAAGTQGLVPAPAKGRQNAFLRGDGTWELIEEMTDADIDAIIAGTYKE